MLRRPAKIVFTAVFSVVTLVLAITPSSLASADSRPPVLLNTSQNIPSLQKVDARVLILQYYLSNQGSPLKDYAKEIISAADSNGLDWKLLPAISAVESKFGKVIPFGKSGMPTSFNAWGWGVHSGQSVYFTSWQDGIEKVSEGLKEKFVSVGLVNPDLMNPKYSSNPDWGWQVDYYLDDLDSYQKDFLNKFSKQIDEYNQSVSQRNLQSQISFQIQ